MLDFFVAAPGRRRARARLRAGPDPDPLHRGVGAGLQRRRRLLRRARARRPGSSGRCELFGTVPLAELAAPGRARSPARVSSVNRRAGVLPRDPGADPHPLRRGGARSTRRRAACSARATRSASPSSATRSSGSAPRARSRSTAARSRRRISDWVVERGGTLGRGRPRRLRDDRARAGRGRLRGREVLTNPPPSSGGILIAFALELLERAGRRAGHRGDRRRRWRRRRRERTARVPRRPLRGRASPRRFLAADRLGSTTHITAVDGDGICASVTCSNGTGSGLIVPGTGVHVNNMLGEQDLNPLGFHRHEAGRRLPSMMSPTVVLRDGELEAGLGSGGSNRIRSAILQTIVAPGRRRPRRRRGGRSRRGCTSRTAPSRPSPGSTRRRSSGSQQRGYEVVRWPDRNVFFGGVHAVARDPATGELAGAGDPRRGGAVAVA